MEFRLYFVLKEKSDAGGPRCRRLYSAHRIEAGSDARQVASRLAAGPISKAARLSKFQRPNRHDASSQPFCQMCLYKFVIIQVGIAAIDAIDFFALSRRKTFSGIEAQG